MTKCNRVKDTDQTWVVYCHYEEDQVVYIGSGQVHRAFQFIKRSEDHCDWMVKQALRYRTAEFARIVFTSDYYDEVRYLESRLIPTHKPKFNKNIGKLTLDDISYARKHIDSGVSLRRTSVLLGISHNNLRTALLPKYARNNYDHIRL